eukprot:c7656_g1_i2 orf=69-323(+)
MEFRNVSSFFTFGPLENYHCRTAHSTSCFSSQSSGDFVSPFYDLEWDHVIHGTYQHLLDYGWRESLSGYLGSQMFRVAMQFLKL